MATKRELEAQIRKLEKLQAKTKTIETKVSVELDLTKWNTLAGHYGNSVSLAPFVEGGKYASPAVFVKMTQSATKTGLDKIREQKLDDAGILTA